MKLFDAHCHAGYTNGITRVADADGLLEVQKACSIEAACIQTIVIWKPENILRNLLSVMLKAENPDYFHIFGGIVFPAPGHAKPDLVSQARQLIDAGFDGIKLFGKPTVRAEYDLPFTHESYRELYAYLEERDIPVLFHVGDPAGFWDPGRCTPEARAMGWYYGEGSYPPLERLYGEVEEFMRDFPSLRILFPHMLFMSDDLSRLEAMLERYPGMRTDVTPGIEMYRNMNRNRKEAAAFFTRRAGRILLGTDNGGNNAHARENLADCMEKTENILRFFSTNEPFVWEKAEMAGLGLSGDALTALCSGGFEDFLKPRRALDAEKTLALCGWWHNKAAEGHAKNLEEYGAAMDRIKVALKIKQNVLSIK